MINILKEYKIYMYMICAFLKIVDKGVWKEYAFYKKEGNIFS